MEAGEGEEKMKASQIPTRIKILQFLVAPAHAWIMLCAWLMGAKLRIEEEEHFTEDER